MAEEGASFQKILISFIFISLFTVLLVTWAINLGEEYGDNYGQNPEYVTQILGVEDIYSNVQETQQTAETWRESFQKQNIFSAIAGIVATGVFDLANFMVQAILTPFKLFGNVMTNVLGFPPFMVSILTGVLIIAIIFGIWRLIKIGY